MVERPQLLARLSNIKPPGSTGAAWSGGLLQFLRFHGLAQKMASEAVAPNADFLRLDQAVFAWSSHRLQNIRLHAGQITRILRRPRRMRGVGLVTNCAGDAMDAEAMTDEAGYPHFSRVRRIGAPNQRSSFARRTLR